MNEQIKPPEKSIDSIESLVPKLIDVSEFYINVPEQIIVTSKTRIYNCLLEYSNRTEGKQKWITPLGIFITLVATFTTSTFKSALGLSSDTLRAIFIIAGIATFVWLIWSVKSARGSKGIKDVLDDIEETSLIKNY